MAQTLEFEKNDGISQFQKHSTQVNEKLENFKIYSFYQNALCNLKNHFNENAYENRCVLVLPSAISSIEVISLAPYVLASKKTLIITRTKSQAKRLYNEMCNYNNKTIYEERKFLKDKDREKFIEKGFLMNDTRDSSLSGYNLVITFTQLMQPRYIEQMKENKFCFDLVIIHECTDKWELFEKSFPNKKIYISSDPPKEFNNSVSFKCKVSDLYITERIRDIKIEDPKINIPAVTKSILDAITEHDEQDGRIKHQAILMVNKKEANYVLKQLSSEKIKAESVVFFK